MKKFIALDANKYKLKKGIVPVSLSWKTKTIKGKDHMTVIPSSIADIGN